MSRSNSADRRNTTVKAETLAKQQKQSEAKASLTSLAAYMALKNPSSKQVEEAINLLASVQSTVIRGVIGT